MIITVTPNPSIDRTLRIPPLVRGELIRAVSATSEAGGKGVNVSRLLASFGHATRAIAPLSDESAALFRALLRGDVDLDAVTIRGPVRTNVSLVENDGTVTKINEPGPELDYTETGALISRAADTARAGDWVVGAGSLPQGVAADFYVRLADAMPRGIRVAIDADGAALRACLGCPIALLKPNRRELETLVGRALATLGEVVTAAREVVEAGADTLLVSLGQDGAVLVGRDGAVHAEARITDVRNNVGAGDALLAGFLAAGHDRAALPVAVAWAVAACRSPGTAVARVTDRDFGAVTVQDAVGTRRLAA